ncbi:hypothetical protein BCR35DRAFT_336386 [Leucosporidium creatinivorum]|uniref:Uncharacterized protein n=1 Tax=Leucosporidium creatinivorum TaxID=106004 RepID=A0A1Y2C8R2_9BASI|nr:hypothetical protein BCR35DRAFT_336386 [Leucosporidium creatinivorum]
MADPSFSATASLQSLYSHAHVASLIPPLKVALTPDDVPTILRDIASFAHLFVAGGSQPPAFPPGDGEERIKADQAAQATLGLVHAMRRDSAASVLGLGKKRREVLYTHITGGKHSGRPLVDLFLVTESAIHHYVRSMSKRMVDAIKTPQALGAASELLFVGTRDWAELTRWEKMHVAVEAQRYFHDMKGKALTRRPTGSLETSEVEASIGHQHLPSLTSRQAQRSGVSQSRLRARWA